MVNCAGWPNDILSENVYMCSATGGAYNHAKCKYFGMYRGKRVDEKAKVKWHIAPGRDADFIQQAREKLQKIRQMRPRQYPFYL